MPPAAAAAPGPTLNGGAELRVGYQAEAQAEVAAELAQLATRLGEEDRGAARLQDEAYAAYSAGDEAKGDKLHAKMLRHLAAATALAERRNVLSQPAEVDRRVQGKLARAASRARLDSYLTSRDEQ